MQPALWWGGRPSLPPQYGALFECGLLAETSICASAWHRKQVRESVVENSEAFTLVEAVVVCLVTNALSSAE